ncbi:MAG: efflux RND transporter periplasmic adaptor subunit [Burkholderiaceae bacterium]
MKRSPLQGRILALLAISIPLAAIFFYVGLRSGPLAPIAVTVATVKTQKLAPALFGIGTVEARHTYRIGPTFAGRLKRLDVHVNDRVQAGQVLGEMDPVDLDDRIRSQDSAFRRSEAALREATARHAYTQTQAERYKQLFAARSTSEETLFTRQYELQIAEAALMAAREDVARIRADREALQAQRNSLRLIAPADGVVVLREADPGTTLVAGQAVVEIIAPHSLWINARFDQISALGLAQELPAQIVLRSRGEAALPGRVLRVEPKADAVTEETLAKVIFDSIPLPLPPLGELAEITLALDPLLETPVLSNAAIRFEDGKAGVWKLIEGSPRFTPIKLGASDLDGLVQVLEGLDIGDQVVLHSESALRAKSRIHVVDFIQKAQQ